MTVVSRTSGYGINHQTLQEMRFLAVRMIKHGARVENIARGMGLHRSTVFGWVRKFRIGGRRALRSTKATGRPPKLRQQQILTLVKMLRRPAMNYGFSSDLWTGPRVRILIWKKFRIRLHPKHMPRFLKRLGMVRKSPERRALEQDPQAVRRWKRRILPAILRAAAQCRGLVLYGDEAMFVLIPYVGKTWTFPDIKPIARVSGKRGIHVGVTSAVSPRGHLVFQLSKGNFNTATLIRFMKALHRHFERRKIFFIIDGAPPHKARAVDRFVQDNASWLSLHRLPGYSPELDPAEEVWNFAKTKRLNAKPTRTKKELQSAVIGALRSLQKNPERVRSFFEK